MWKYWRDNFAEYGTWIGETPPDTPTHFHHENQLSFVLRGGLLFNVYGKKVHVAAGQCLYIPSNCPHSISANSKMGNRCIHVYSADLSFGPMPALLQFLPGAPPHSQPILSRLSLGKFYLQHQLMANLSDPISRVAALSGLSRETFTRTFSREAGISPREYRLMKKLNEARRRLQIGMPLAEVAVDCGFFDQSHMSRHFSRVFGTTPGAYLKSFR